MIFDEIDYANDSTTAPLVLGRRKLKYSLYALGCGSSPGTGQ